MDQIAIDPHMKQKIKDALYSFLYDPVQQHFKNRIDTLIKRNTLMGGYSHRHFTYRGSVYNSDVTPPPTKKNSLHSSLQKEMDEYLTDLNDINKHELPYILGFINQVLNSSSDLNDYLRILPDSVHDPLNKLASTCPCRAQSLDEAQILQLTTKNREPIRMMKRRLVTNLLL